MSAFYLDITFSLITYAILMGIIIWRKKKNHSTDKDSDDEDGGISVWPEPDLDLPPGICLPGDGPTKKTEVEEYC